MDALLRLINEPGPARWLFDGLVIPVVVILGVIVARAFYVKRAQTAGEADVVVQVRRQTSAIVAAGLGLALLTIAWHYRLVDLAARPDTPLTGRDELVDWLSGTSNAVIATAVLGLLIYGINRAFRFAVGRLDTWQQARRGVRMQGNMLISPAQVRQFIIISLRGMRIFLVLALLYVYVPLMLSLLPATRPLAGRVVPLVLEPVRNLSLAAIGYLPRLVSLIIIIVMVRYLLRMLTLVMRLVGRGAIRIPGFDAEWADQTERLLRIAVVLGTVMILYPFLPGAGSEVFKGFSLFIGAMFTFGASSSVSNMISGIILTYTRSFRIGDRINIGQATGDVISRGLFVTRIRTIYNEEVTIPNNVALQGRVTNFSAAARGEGLVLQVSAGIGYDVDWRHVHELMKKAAAATEHILDDPEPVVLQIDLGNYAVAYELQARTDDPQLALRTQSLLRQNVLDQFNDAGVEIMTPSVSALRNSPEPTIPADFVADSSSRALRFASLGESS